MQLYEGFHLNVMLSLNVPRTATLLFINLIACKTESVILHYIFATLPDHS